MEDESSFFTKVEKDYKKDDYNARGITLRHLKLNRIYNFYELELYFYDNNLHFTSRICNIVKYLYFSLFFLNFIFRFKKNTFPGK